MNRPLRKRHLQVWIILAFLLPAAFLSALLVRNSSPSSSTLVTKEEPFLPVVIASKTVKGNLVQLRGITKNSVEQLVWKNKTALEVPSASIYLLTNNSSAITPSNYIGRIESRGDYSFPVPKAEKYEFALFDFIHQRVIEKISFERAGFN